MSSNTRVDKSLAKIAYLTKWMGITLEKKERFLNKDLFVYIFNFMWLNTNLAGAITWFVVGVQNGESLANLTYQAPCLMTSFVGEIKTMCLIIYQDKVHELLSSLRNLENDELFRNSSRDGDEMVRKETRFLNFVIRVLNFFSWALLIAFPLTPLSLTILRYLDTEEFNPQLPFFALYPFDAYNIKIFPFVFMKQVVTESIVMLSILCADLLFFIFSTYIRIQFHLLAFEIERLIPADAPEHLTSDGTLETRIKEVVRWHQKLFHSVDLLEAIYSKSTLFNFVSSSVLICVTGFNVTTIGEGEPAFVVSFLSFLFTSLSQIYFLCFYGDMLMSSSEDVAAAVYNCKWYKADLKAAKMLLTIQTRAHKACKLTAFGFADVNFRAFTKILSTAWSYFALLKTVESAPK